MEESESRRRLPWARSAERLVAARRRAAGGYRRAQEPRTRFVRRAEDGHHTPDPNHARRSNRRQPSIKPRPQKTQAQTEPKHRRSKTRRGVARRARPRHSEPPPSRQGPVLVRAAALAAAVSDTPPPKRLGALRPQGPSGEPGLFSVQLLTQPAVVTLRRPAPRRVSAHAGRDGRRGVPSVGRRRGAAVVVVPRGPEEVTASRARVGPGAETPAAAPGLGSSAAVPFLRPGPDVSARKPPTARASGGKRRGGRARGGARRVHAPTGTRGSAAGKGRPDVRGLASPVFNPGAPSARNCTPRPSTPQRNRRQQNVRQLRRRDLVVGGRRPQICP